MTTVDAIRPAWGLPCLSRVITKAEGGRPAAPVRPAACAPGQDPMSRAADGPNARPPEQLPADGTRVGDSEAMRLHPAARHGDRLDRGAAPAERACMTAFTRRVDEHPCRLAVVQPRWADEVQWPVYRSLLFGEPLTPPLAAMAEAARAHILAPWVGNGLGRMPAARAEDRSRASSLGQGRAPTGRDARRSLAPTAAIPGAGAQSSASKEPAPPVGAFDGCGRGEAISPPYAPPRRAPTPGTPPRVGAVHAGPDTPRSAP